MEHWVEYSEGSEEMTTLDGKLLWPDLTNPKGETREGQTVMIT